MAAFDIGRIDDVIHGRMRLGIMAYLADAEVADFNELKRRWTRRRAISRSTCASSRRPAISQSRRASWPQAADPRADHSGRAQAFAGYLEAMAGLVGKAGGS